MHILAYILPWPTVFCYGDFIMSKHFLCFIFTKILLIVFRRCCTSIFEGATVLWGGATVFWGATGGLWRKKTSLYIYIYSIYIYSIYIYIYTHIYISYVNNEYVMGDNEMYICWLFIRMISSRIDLCKRYFRGSPIYVSDEDIIHRYFCWT